MAEKSSRSASSTSTTTANVGKLYRLLFDGGTKAVKIQLEKHFTPFPSKLVNFLKTKLDKIQELVESKILNSDQLNQLCPTDRSDPDPEKFDISLIILILTNFCELHPPRTGWSNMPQEKDRSLSAKLVRLRLFRNKLLHRSNTRFKEKEFLDLWKKLQGILCSLGLPSSDIEKLRLEDCEEKYYFEILKKWANSEEDSNRRFKAIYENQVKAQKTLQDTNQRVLLVEQNQMEACKLQQEDHRTLEDTRQVAQDTNQGVRRVEQNQMEADKLRQMDHRTLADTHQVAQDTNQRVLLVEQNQMEAGKLQQVDHRTLADTHQVAQDTNQRVHRVEQNQMEAGKLQQVDHETLEDTHQVAQDINQRVHRVEQNQMEADKLRQVDHRTLADTHQVAKGVQRSVQDTKQIVEKVLRTQQETQQQVKEVAADAKERRDKGKEDEALRKLAKVNTERVIQYHSEKYQEGTRLLIFEKIKLWLDDLTSEHRVMVISGDAGMGKSVISAVVCPKMEEAGRLSGSHFCDYNKERYRNPKVMLQSLACQLCDVLPEYKSELVKKLSRNLGVDMNSLEVQELFEFLFEEPLCSVGDPGRNLLLVVDGLDECEYQRRNELLDVIANHFSTLPVWLRFFVTTRPEINIADRLQQFNPIQLEQDDEENVKDIRLFLERQLQSSCEEVIYELTRKADGHILFAFLMVRFIEENVSRLDPEELRKMLPSGVSDVYMSYFYRMEKALNNIEELTISADQLLSFLSAVAAAREPLPLDFVSKLLLSDTKSPAGHRKVRKAIECISTLLPVQDGCIHVFHKSVKDWLTDRTAYGRHDFSVDEKQGHLALSELCAGELSDVKRRGVHGTEFSDTAKYALQHGVHHMLESEEEAESTRSFEEIVNNYVTDLDIVYAKLCVNNTASSEDIILTQKPATFQALSSERRKALGTLLSLLRKHRRRLSTHPGTIFQVMVNEGGDVFAGEATKVLQSREIPYMEYFHKEALKEFNKTQAEFPCKSAVACFDISPKQEFMVCECTDGMIYLWSLKTGEKRWVRPVEVKKFYGDLSDHLRVVPNSNVYSCYRSVVFHPTEPIVLPGILSHAYSFKGNLQSLFPKSNCRFSVCSVHGDESKIITDCPGDAKCLVMWNLKNGEEITRTIRNEDVLSFAWSPDGTLLAISHFSGLVCLVDASNCLETTLAEITTCQPCGMIKFTPDIQFLFCLSSSCRETLYNFNGVLQSIEPTLSFHLNVFTLPCGTFCLNVLDVSRDFFVHDPRDYESSSKGGFLTGDPMFFICPTHGVLEKSQGFAFVLNKQSELRVLSGNSIITMFEHEDNLMATLPPPFFYHHHLAFALDGKTIYSSTAGTNVAQVVSLDVSSGDRKAEKVINTDNSLLSALNVSLVPVSEGVVLEERNLWMDVQLWNFELSQRVRRWPNLTEVSDILPFSDQCVACVWRDFVSILDTSNGNIVKTIPLRCKEYRSIVCSSKYQLLSTTYSSVQLSDDKNELWKRNLECPHCLVSWSLPGMFSPTEEFVLVSSLNSESNTEVLVLQASSGKTLRTLCTVDSICGCVFVSKTECVILCKNTSGSYCLPLFNVRTGDFLTVLDIDFDPSWGLASCPQKGLIAIGLRNSKRMCTFIQVKQLRDKVNREAKGEQCVYSLSLVEEFAKFT